MWKRSLKKVNAKVSKQNRFQYCHLFISNGTRMSSATIRNEIKLIYHIKPPEVYSRHIFYINFANYGIT